GKIRRARLDRVPGVPGRRLFGRSRIRPADALRRVRIPDCATALNGALVAEVRRPEAVRDERSDGEALDLCAVAVRTKDLDVAAAQLSRLEDRLAAAAARGADDCSGPASHGDPRDLVEPERVLRRCERALLRAEAEAVTGVLHIGARDGLAIHRLDRAADLKTRVR